MTLAPVIKVNEDGIPEELKMLPQWILWKLTKEKDKDGNWKDVKRPYRATSKKSDPNKCGDELASSTDPNTWSTYDEAIHDYKTGNYAGIAFVIENGFIGMDWDDIKNTETGEYYSDALAEIHSMGSYAEISQSGTGVHVIGKGKVPSEKGVNMPSGEMYDHGRFFVVTGQHLDGTPTDINDVPKDAIQAMYNRLKPEKEEGTSKSAFSFTKSPELTDEKVISLCMGARNADKFEALYEGYTSMHEGDHSAADQALCSILAFYTQDLSQIDRLFRRSQLIRPKWDEKRGNLTYGEMTIHFALDGLTEIYTPPTYERDNDTEKDVTEISQEELKELAIKQKNRRMVDLKEVLPEQHLINQLTSWMSSITDGYYEYQVTSALWMLSAATQGKVELRLKQEVVKPNIWVIVLGKSTTSRKSTVVNKARSIYASATDTTLYNDDYSIEGYLETLSEHPICNFVRDEAAGLFAKYHKKYNEGIFEAECAIYDCQDYKKTLASGKNNKPKEYVVKSPCVTHLYASTPDNFSRYMRIEDFESGYGYRFLYAYPNYRHERKPLEVETKEDVNMWAKLQARIRILYNHFKDCNMILFEVDDDAMEYYNQILEALEDEAEKADNDMVNSAVGRAQVHILKIAMLIEIGMPEISTTMHKRSIILASSLVIDYFLPSCLNIIDRLQEDIRYNQIEKVVSALRRLGGTSDRSRLLRYSKLKKKDFDDCIETLLESKAISEHKVTDTGAMAYVLLDDSKKINIDTSKSFHKLRALHELHCFTEGTKGEVKLVKNQDKGGNNTAIRATFEHDITDDTVKLVQSVKQENGHGLDLFKLEQWCHKWEETLQETINSSNYVGVTHEYCRKHKVPPDQLNNVKRVVMRIFNIDDKQKGDYN
ncbi:DUF3987 domain-containing protein [Methanococcoides orientis]|uniref:phage NrS-1 polymerase family protein n=1 Tax=Methanococcoides orientis TaxID=2822137 RepID=UPI001E5FC68D|nr:DUF3987 domain-containing protein [Methanococcoides orientis]UGV40256.1 DUF3987 domain-containing protein [Methanococcoides orientis]